jgi:hypothetical protein
LDRRTLRCAIAATLVLLAGACTASPPVKPVTWPTEPAPPTFRPTAPIRLDATGPVAVPSTGALVGAWVKPHGTLSQTARVSAIDGLQQGIGRELDIVNTYRRMTDPLPTTSDYQLTAHGATLMVSWATPDTREITSGRDDTELIAWAHRFASFGRPILLRMRWEMDRPNLRATMWSGADFIAAWKHMRAIFEAQHVTNISWVWCPTATGFINGSAPAFYPGDNEVDWTCVDVYSSTELQPLAQLLQPFLAWAAGHPKPIVIGEFGVANAYSPAERSAWLQAAARVFRADPQIKAVSYFDSDPAGSLPTGGFALPPDSPPLQAFAAMARTSYFNPMARRLSLR